MLSILLENYTELNNTSKVDMAHRNRFSSYCDTYSRCADIFFVFFLMSSNILKLDSAPRNQHPSKTRFTREHTSSTSTPSEILNFEITFSNLPMHAA